MTWLLLFVVAVALLFLDWKASTALSLLRQNLEVLRQLRDSANRSEQEALERRAEAIKRGVGG